MCQIAAFITHSWYSLRRNSIFPFSLNQLRPKLHSKFCGCNPEMWESLNLGKRPIVVKRNLTTPLETAWPNKSSEGVKKQPSWPEKERRKGQENVYGYWPHLHADDGIWIGGINEEEEEEWWSLPDRKRERPFSVRKESRGNRNYPYYFVYFSCY